MKTYISCKEMHHRGNVFASCVVRIKAVPKKEMIVCKMNGKFPELLGKCDVTPCISEAMKYMEESEKYPLSN